MLSAFTKKSKNQSLLLKLARFVTKQSHLGILINILRGFTKIKNSKKQNLHPRLVLFVTKHFKAIHLNEKLKASKSSINICIICDKTFPFSWTLKVHLRSHQNKEAKVSDPSLRTCTICNKTYSKTGNLKIHLNNVHQNEDITKILDPSRKTCTFCNKKFSCD